MAARDIFGMSTEERAELTDEDVMELAYMISHFEPWDVNAYSLRHQNAVLGELRPRLKELEAQELARRQAQQALRIARVMCDCGHSVAASQRMNASMGTACPDCYDRMS